MRGCYLQGLWFGTFKPSSKEGVEGHKGSRSYWGVTLQGHSLSRQVFVLVTSRPCSRRLLPKSIQFSAQHPTTCEPLCHTPANIRSDVLSFQFSNSLIHQPLLLSKYDTKEYFHDVCNFQMFSRVREDFAEYDSNVISLSCGAGCYIDTMLGQTIRLIRWTMTHWSMRWLYQFVVGCDTHVE